MILPAVNLLPVSFRITPVRFCQNSSPSCFHSPANEHTDIKTDTAAVPHRQSSRLPIFLMFTFLLLFYFHFTIILSNRLPLFLKSSLPYHFQGNSMPCCPHPLLKNIPFFSIIIPLSYTKGSYFSDYEKECPLSVYGCCQPFSLHRL